MPNVCSPIEYNELWAPWPHLSFWWSVQHEVFLLFSTRWSWKQRVLIQLLPSWCFSLQIENWLDWKSIINSIYGSDLLAHGHWNMNRLFRQFLFEKDLHYNLARYAECKRKLIEWDLLIETRFDWNDFFLYFGMVPLLKQLILFFFKLI